MKTYFFQIILLLLSSSLFAQEIVEESENRITSVVDSTNADNLVLQQSFTINVPLDSVWNAYTTEKGWESWATSIAEIDFKVNGVIKTNYNKDGKIGDESTIVLNIINYVPKRAITLQAELSDHFPAFMKHDEKDLFNLILFEEISEFETKVISFGIGYKNNEKYMSLLDFFIKGNEQSYHNLISYLETGKSSVKY